MPLTSPYSFTANFAKMRSHLSLSLHQEQTPHRQRGNGANGSRVARIFFGRPFPLTASEGESDRKVGSFMALRQRSQTAKRYDPTVPAVEKQKKGLLEISVN
jgi:hypothetical protein